MSFVGSWTHYKPTLIRRVACPRSNKVRHSLALHTHTHRERVAPKGVEPWHARPFQQALTSHTLQHWEGRESGSGTAISGFLVLIPLCTLQPLM